MQERAPTEGPTQLGGRVCLITGASRGLGREVASAFAAAGAHVILVARHRQDLERVACSLPPPAAVECLATDVGDAGAPERLRDAIAARFGRLDVMIHAAAIQGPIGPLVDCPPDQWERTLRVNLVAPVAITRACLPLMTGASGRPKIVFISGGGATSARPRFSAYAAAKCGLVRFAETLAEELRGAGVDVNCVAPGTMRSAMTEAVVAAGPVAAGEREYRQAERTLAEGSGALEQAVALCAYLASSASDGVTGKLIAAVWDPWASLAEHLRDLHGTDVYTLRRILPKDRGFSWGEP